ncbi:uncharacterized protein LOC127130323 [Lathyrus oleraceus]|uniref:uncharacterized protein LOC127130323 n=1 Tax=Pisum sativum TaxID=3888 RepID=UPI0021D03781|nr:uncharacterized protein LOC127130323 [Pisum sativum]
MEKRQYLEGISITDKKALRKLSSKFFLNGDVLYKRNSDSVLLRCVDIHEASTIIESIHEGCKGVHAKGPTMAKKILRVGTSIRTSTWATTYSLVYGMEVVLPIEVEIPSLRVIMKADLDEAEWVQSRYDQLNLIEEKRLTIVCHGQLYQRRLKRAFDKKVLPREHRAGELMLKRYSSIHSDPQGKWTPNYEGPFIVKKAFSGGSLILTTIYGRLRPML